MAEEFGLFVVAANGDITNSFGLVVENMEEPPVGATPLKPELGPPNRLPPPVVPPDDGATNNDPLVPVGLIAIGCLIPLPTMLSASLLTIFAAVSFLVVVAVNVGVGGIAAAIPPPVNGFTGVDWAKVAVEPLPNAALPPKIPELNVDVALVVVERTAPNGVSKTEDGGADPELVGAAFPIGCFTN